MVHTDAQRGVADQDGSGHGAHAGNQDDEDLGVSQVLDVLSDQDGRVGVAQEHVSNSNERLDLGGAHQLTNSLTDPLDDEADNAQVVQDRDQGGDEDDAAQGLHDKDIASLAVPQGTKDEVQAVSAAVQQCGNAIGQDLQCLSTDGDLDDDECDHELSDNSLDDGLPLNVLLVPGQQPAQCDGDSQTQNVLQINHSVFLFSFDFLSISHAPHCCIEKRFCSRSCGGIPI